VDLALLRLVLTLRNRDAKASTGTDLHGSCFEQLISDLRTDRVVLYAYPGWASAGRRLRRVSVAI
jgi:hypothetical protein